MKPIKAGHIQNLVDDFIRAILYGWGKRTSALSLS